jgi:hypothetical protein
MSTSEVDISWSGRPTRGQAAGSMSIRGRPIGSVVRVLETPQTRTLVDDVDTH